MMELDSIVNSVAVHLVGEELIVRKVFLSQAKLLKIGLPRERILIEERILLILANEISFPNIYVPELFGTGTDYLETKLVDGLTLASLGDAICEIPMEMWFSLGAWSACCELYLFNRRRHIFANAWDAQSDVAAILKDLKTPHANFDSLVMNSVSLGDFGCSNIIWNGSQFYVFDYEFGHLSSRGRDLAQVLCQISNKYGDKSVQQLDALLSGYLSAGGVALDVEYWKKHFKEYYENHRNNAT